MPTRVILTLFYCQLQITISGRSQIISFMKSEQTFTAPKAPLDEEGYFKSFDLATCSMEELIPFYEKYGVVVFRDVITPEEINLSIDDLWRDTIAFFGQFQDKPIKREDPETWSQIKGWQKSFGFVNQSIIHQPQFWRNRKNPSVYHCFKKTYSASLKGKEIKEPLLCNFDRGSMILPSGRNPQWMGDDLYHFDIDPWLWVGAIESRYPKMSYQSDEESLFLGEGNYDPNIGYTKLAGVLALSDTNQTSGGFSCALGFQNFIRQWCEQNPYYTDITADKNLMDNFSKVFVRKGSLLIFSRELPHNIYPNLSTEFRYAQYLRMSPQSSLQLSPELYKARRKLVRSMLPKDLDVSDPISQEIFMLDGDKRYCRTF